MNVDVAISLAVIRSEEKIQKVQYRVPNGVRRTVHARRFSTIHQVRVSLLFHNSLFSLINNVALSLRVPALSSL